MSILSISVSVSAIITFAVGLLIGCLTCLCYIRLHKHQTGISNNYYESTPSTIDNKDAARVYEIISMHPTEIKGKEMDIVKNSAYGELPGPPFVH